MGQSLLRSRSHSKTSRFVPKSTDISSVFRHLQDIVKDLDSTLAGFAVSHMAKRNEELHSGKRPFDKVASSTWLPTYYETCSVLLESLGSTLEMFFGKAEADIARQMIKAAKHESAKAVAKEIQAHRIVWEAKTAAEQAKAVAQATAWATKHVGHRVVCPSCFSPSILTGGPVAPPTKALADDQIVETQYYLPSKFECIACGLKISGLSSLHAGGLGDTYKVTRLFDAVDYYAPTDEYSGYEEDNNEK